MDKELQEKCILGIFTAIYQIRGCQWPTGNASCCNKACGCWRGAKQAYLTIHEALLKIIQEERDKLPVYHPPGTILVTLEDGVKVTTIK